MQKIIYNIHSDKPLIIGYSEENAAREVEFSGFNRQRTDTTVYLMVDGIGLYPLLDFVFQISYTYTQNEGKYDACLIEKTADNSFILKGPTMRIIVKHSVPIGSMVVPSNPTMSEWFTAMGALYQTVQTKLQNGEFIGATGPQGPAGQNGSNGANGADGFSPTVTTSKSGKTTTITITDKDGQHTATVVDGTDGQNGRDGSDASVTSQNIANALGYTPADAQGLANTDEHIAEDIEPALEQLNEDIASKLTEPSSGLAVGKYFKVASIDADGHAVLEACDLPIASADNLGVIKTSTNKGTYVDNGIICATTTSNYSTRGTDYIIGKGTLESAKKEIVDSILCSDSASEALTVAQQTKALARLNAEKAKGEWVLKGTLNTDNKDSGCTVDFSGCTEFYIRSITDTIVTATSSLSSNLGGLVSDVFTTSRKSMFAWFSDFVLGYYCVAVRHGSNTASVALAYTPVSYCGVNGQHINNINLIKFTSPSNVTSCNLEIYAR